MSATSRTNNGIVGTTASRRRRLRSHPTPLSALRSPPKPSETRRLSEPAGAVVGTESGGDVYPRGCRAGTSFGNASDLSRCVVVGLYLHDNRLSGSLAAGFEVNASYSTLELALAQSEAQGRGGGALGTLGTVGNTGGGTETGTGTDVIGDAGSGDGAQLGTTSLLHARSVLCELPYLQVLDVGLNDLVGPLPDDVGCTDVQCQQAASFTTAWPTEEEQAGWGGDVCLPRLRVLNVADNRLSGQVCEALARSPMLAYALT